MDRFFAGAVLSREIAKRGSVPPRAERAKEEPVAQDRRLVGHSCIPRNGISSECRLMLARGWDMPCPVSA